MKSSLLSFPPPLFHLLSPQNHFFKRRCRLFYLWFFSVDAMTPFSYKLSPCFFFKIVFYDRTQLGKLGKWFCNSMRSKFYFWLKIGLLVYLLFCLGGVFFALPIPHPLFCNAVSVIFIYIFFVSAKIHIAINYFALYLLCRVIDKNAIDKNANLFLLRLWRKKTPNYL